MLYHFKVYMPSDVLAIVPKVPQQLRYSDHAKRAANNDRYGKLILPEIIHYHESTIVEIDTAEDKILSRHKMTETLDIVIASIPGHQDGHRFVKTAWINRVTDKHHTLDRSKYVQKVKFGR